MTWTGKSLSLLLLLSLFACKPAIKEPEAMMQIIPLPAKLISEPGFFELQGELELISPRELKLETEDLASFMEQRAKVAFGKNGKQKLQLLLLPAKDFGLEAYSLLITKEEIKLTAASKRGISNGIASIKQLILLNTYSGDLRLPCLEINDQARFKHRGMLLDCSRHFFSVAEVKRYIELLALYKMNVLHWHLTEDQAWRIAIDKYPRLTSVGAFRREKDGKSYGGFYSKKEIREIVAYAQIFNITIIPEIELPGHAQAAIAAYPQLSCTGDSIAVANDWGVFKDIYCAGNEEVFRFLEEVLEEVMELFPSKYIHIGGDEAPKTRWESCDKCQKRIREEGLHDEHELQSYFITRIARFLNKKGREIIGWDEILEGGLPPGASIQSWRGMEGGIAAVKQGHQAIMSPTSHAYFDYSVKSIDLKKVFAFEPIPEGLSEAEQKLIIGGECNLWTEHIPDQKTLDAQVFPRLLAMAEVLWSDSNERNFEEFSKRVQAHYRLLDSLKVNYGDESPALSYQIRSSREGSYLSLTPYSKDLQLYFRLNSILGDSSFQDYHDPIELTKSCSLLVKAEKNGRKYGDLVQVVFDKHLGLGRPIQYKNAYSDWYTAGGESALLDGKLGSLDFRDGSWQGFWGKDFECVIDLDSASIQSLSAGFYQYTNSWIYVPPKMELEISADSLNWEPWGSIESNRNPKNREKFIHRMGISKAEARPVKYLKIKIFNFGTNPDWHEAAGADAWIFIDEISIK